MSKSRQNFYISDFKKIDLFLQICFQIFLNFWHDIKKWHFDVHFDAARPCRPSRFRLVLQLLQTTQAREKSCHAMVSSAVWRQPTFQSATGPGPRRVQGEAGSQLGWSLALSKCNNVAAPFWADSWYHSALLHACQLPGEVSLHFTTARSKLNGP